MKFLAGKKILLGLTGSIAAYKAAELTRLLVSAGAEVRVVMTQAAQQFIAPLTLQALSAHPVSTQLLDANAEAAMDHISLARWADVVLIAPASANFLAKLTHGLADDLLSTLCLASHVPLFVAPAMNVQMWLADATQQNVQVLQRRKVTFLGPDSGGLACGEVGAGRMLDPALMVELIADTFASVGLKPLLGKKVVLSAGPTHENIDPVRFLANRSSGKMGYALAKAAHEAGAEVVLVSGPVALSEPKGVSVVRVVSAQQMLDAVMAQMDGCDVFIAAAAVADYRVKSPADEKIKKSGMGADLVLTLVENADIVASVGALEHKPFVLGFAAETNGLEENALGKLKRKNMDLIAANWVNKAGLGFASDNNQLKVFSASEAWDLGIGSKVELAKQLIALVSERI